MPSLARSLASSLASHPNPPSPSPRLPPSSLIPSLLAPFTHFCSCSAYHSPLAYPLTQAPPPILSLRLYRSLPPSPLRRAAAGRGPGRAHIDLGKVLARCGPDGPGGDRAAIRAAKAGGGSGWVWGGGSEVSVSGRGLGRQRAGGSAAHPPCSGPRGKAPFADAVMLCIYSCLLR